MLSAMMRRREATALLAALAAAAICHGAGLAADEADAVGTDEGAFSAGVAKVEITPERRQMLRGYSPRLSTGVLDPLFHRAVAMRLGDDEFILVSSDLCSLSPAFCDEATDRLAAEFGLPPENVWWTITHTHSSPYVGPPGVPGILMPNRFQFNLDEDYTAFVLERLGEAAREARAALEPARLTVGRGYAAANINRRARESDGAIRLGMNPAGPVDRRLGLLRLESGEGAPLALLLNYPIHPTVLGGSSTVVSGDVTGAVNAYLEERTGAVSLFLNGAAGNLAPIYRARGEAETRLLRRFEVLLGEPALEAWQRARPPAGDLRLAASRIVLETPMRPGLEWSDELRDYHRLDDEGAPWLRVPLRFLRLADDLVLWSAPMELFCEIASEIRDRSPFAHTCYVGYANGTFGYLPTEAEHLAGGYEAATSPFTPSAAAHLTEAVVRHLREIHGP